MRPTIYYNVIFQLGRRSDTSLYAVVLCLCVSECRCVCVWGGGCGEGGGFYQKSHNVTRKKAAPQQNSFTIIRKWLRPQFSFKIYRSFPLASCSYVTLSTLQTNTYAWANSVDRDETPCQDRHCLSISF